MIFYPGPHQECNHCSWCQRPLFLNQCWLGLGSSSICYACHWQWWWQAGGADWVRHLHTNECGLSVQSSQVVHLHLERCLSYRDPRCSTEDMNQPNDSNFCPGLMYENELVQNGENEENEENSEFVQDEENESLASEREKENKWRAIYKEYPEPKDIVRDLLQRMRHLGEEFVNELLGLNCPGRREVFLSEDFRTEVRQLVEKIAKNDGSGDSDCKTDPYAAAVCKCWYKMNCGYLVERNVLEILVSRDIV